MNLSFAELVNLKYQYGIKRNISVVFREQFTLIWIPVYWILVSFSAADELVSNSLGEFLPCIKGE